MGSSQSNATLRCREPRDDGVCYLAKFSDKPFESGECRYAYHGTLLCESCDRGRARYDGSKVVVKVFKRELAKDFGAWNAEILASKQASELATEFNRQRLIRETVYFPIPYVAKMDQKAGRYILGFIYREYDMAHNPVHVNEWVAMEEYLTGSFTKFNSNSGYVCNSSRGAVMQAFSHWTFHQTDGAFLVCDLQGVCNGNHYQLTDPVIHSTVAHQFGLTDLGVVGQATFFERHTCTDICRGWKKIKMTNEIKEETKKIKPSKHTTFRFQLPQGIKTNKNEFREFAIIRE